MAKYEIVHEKKQENGVENEVKVSDVTIKRVVQSPRQSFLCYYFAT